MQQKTLTAQLNTIAEEPLFNEIITRLASLRADAADKRATSLVTALEAALVTYNSTQSIERAFVQLLPEVLRLSESPFGFLAEVCYSGVGKPYLQSHAVTDIYKRGYGRYDILSNLQFHNLKTLNGAIMTGRCPVVTNDPESDPRSGGVAFGHERLKAFLGLPFLVADELVGAASLGNRPGGYSERDVAFLAPLCKIGGLMIAAHRHETCSVRYARLGSAYFD